jgi:Tol biopolymer transport system component
MIATFVTVATAGALAHRFSEWAPPVNLGSTVNSETFDVCPSVTRTGLSLYFGSTRPGGFGGVDLYVARRQSMSEPWGPPENLGPEVNSPYFDNCPLVTPDGRSLIFLSDRPGSLGLDLYVASRRTKSNDLAWSAPVPLTVLNSPFNELPGSAFEDAETGDLVLYFSSDRAGGFGGYDVYTTRAAEDGALLLPTLVGELSSPAHDLFPTVRKDGKELILSSDRVGTFGSLDLWAATRHDADARWSGLHNLGADVNTSAFEQRSALSWDGRSLIFSTSRDGNFELYEVTRSREHRRSPATSR